MNENGLKDWVLKTDNAKKRFGCCRVRRQTISLSKPLVRLNTANRVKDVILHEIAHALSPLDRGHGMSWRIKARQLGTDTARCYSSNDTIEVKRPLRYKCTKCPYTFDRFRKVKWLSEYIHTKCGGEFKQVK